MKATFIAIIAASAFAGLAGCQSSPRSAAAGGISADLEREFNRLDVNGDGFISREEARRDDAVMRAFDMADKNGDGKLDKSEFKAAPPTGYKAGNN